MRKYWIHGYSTWISIICNVAKWIVTCQSHDWLHCRHNLSWKNTNLRRAYFFKYKSVDWRTAYGFCTEQPCTNTQHSFMNNRDVLKPMGMTDTTWCATCIYVGYFQYQIRGRKCHGNGYLSKLRLHIKICVIKIMPPASLNGEGIHYKHDRPLMIFIILLTSTYIQFTIK